jgi:hypothetical protein
MRIHCVVLAAVCVLLLSNGLAVASQAMPVYCSTRDASERRLEPVQDLGRISFEEQQLSRRTTVIAAGALAADNRLELKSRPGTAVFATVSLQSVQPRFFSALQGSTDSTASPEIRLSANAGVVVLSASAMAAPNFNSSLGKKVFALPSVSKRGDIFALATRPTVLTRSANTVETTFSYYVSPARWERPDRLSVFVHTNNGRHELLALRGSLLEAQRGKWNHFSGLYSAASGEDIAELWFSAEFVGSETPEFVLIDNIHQQAFHTVRSFVQSTFTRQRRTVALEND